MEDEVLPVSRRFDGPAGVGVGVAVGVAVAVTVGVGVAVAVGVGVAVDVGVGVAVPVGVRVGVAVDVAVGVGVAVGSAAVVPLPQLLHITQCLGARSDGAIAPMTANQYRVSGLRPDSTVVIEGSVTC